MIILNQEKINIFCEKNEKNIDVKLDILKNKIKEYEEELNYGYIECSNCHSDKLIGYGVYTRNIGLNGHYLKIKIKRVKCKYCNHTHSLIPSFILPYYQNEVSFIQKIIQEKEVNKKKNKEIEEKYNIYKQLINTWIKRFKKHIERLRTTFSYKNKEIIKELFKGVSSREKYYYKNRVRFLEKIPT